MNIDDYLRAGSEILQDVIRAVDSNNYSDLGKTISSHLNTVLPTHIREDGSVDPSVGSTTQRTGNGAPRGTRASERIPHAYSAHKTWEPWEFPSAAKRDAARQRAEQVRAASQQRMQQGARQAAPVYTAQVSNESTTAVSHFLNGKVDKNTGLWQTIVGACGTVFTLPYVVSSLVRLISAASHASSVGSAIASLVFELIILAVSLGLFAKGRHLRKLIKKYFRYGAQLGPAEYFSFDDLAASNGMATEEIIRELNEMQKRGYLPQARIDEQETTMMLTDSAYKQYQQAEASRAEREKKDQALANELGESASKEVRDIVTQGNAYLKRVREINDLIPDSEPMSGKLYRLEEIMHRIFRQVQKQPRSAKSLRRFMDYYMPTTEKLLGAYIELDKQPTAGENVAGTKREIDEAMDTINDAFENLLDTLFEDVAWDISSDISVMKTMLAQDGLTGASAEKEKEPVPVGDTVH